ncbi:DMT family transporter [Brevibacillus laterosporus]|uniref:DMT family transporter n=1 Tax=Brevibacillus laterosporus TaxID=1465 RepID=UPI002E1B95B3|nr:DMT family transporter [Brevibacillus laterosporus]
MIGLIFAILAGALISLQSVFNANANENVGHWLTTSCVLGLGLISSFVFHVITERSFIINYHTTNNLYYVSGMFGIGLVICIIRAVRLLGPAYTVLISLITQLVIALCIDTFGLFGLEKVPFQMNKLVGIGMLLIGVLIFKDLLPYKKKIVNLYKKGT